MKKSNGKQEKNKSNIIIFGSFDQVMKILLHLWVTEITN